MATTFLPENTYTLEEFINAGRFVTISYDKLAYQDKLSNGTHICVLNVINDYMSEIEQLAVTVQLTKEQYHKYRFKPKLLCHDVYGNSELYYIILLLNGIIDVKDFDFDIIKMIKVDAMNEVISYIYNAESKYMTDYNTDKGTV